MTRPRYIELDGKLYLWRDLVLLRRDQLAACAKVEQPPLFEMRHDSRPQAERTAAGRYLQPGLFDA
jgi:hypothetical protein